MPSSRQQALIPFVPDQKSGMDELGEASPVAVNIVVAGTTVKRRPGLVAYSGATSDVINALGIDGLVATKTGAIYAIGGKSPKRSIYKVTSGGALNLSGTPDADLRGLLRPIIADTGSILAITAGDRAQKVVLETHASSPLANAPQGSYAIYNASRLLIQDPTQNLVMFSEVNLDPTGYSGFEIWGTGIGTAGFIDPGNDPSNAVALGTTSNEVFIFGSRALSVYAPSGPPDQFDPVTAQEFGCAAAYSVVTNDSVMAWLDSRRRIVLGNGRNVQPISDDIQQTLNDMETVSDCYGFRFKEGPVDCLVWVFPTDGRTFAYQIGLGWCEWQGWENGAYAPLPIGCHCLSSQDAVNLVGTTDGKVVALKNNQATDLGTPIQASVTTGFLGHSTDSRKRCIAVRLAMRRGVGSATTEPVGLLSWRDDLGPFNSPIPVSFGTSGDQAIVVSLRSLGVYRRRQWRFTFTGSEDFALSGATEEFEVLSM